MTAVDWVARSIAVRARVDAGGRKAPGTALAAMALAAVRPIDLVMIGDSTALFGGHGWDAALTRAYAKRFGQWASPLYPQEQPNQGYNSQGWGTAVVAPSSGSSDPDAPAYFNDRGLPSAVNHYRAATSLSSTNGIVIDADSPLDCDAALRYHVFHGVFDTGGGSFRLAARKETPGYQLIAEGAVVSTNGGALGEAEAVLDVQAAARVYAVGFKLYRPNGTATVAPTLSQAQRVQNLDRESGVSLHTFYGQGGQSLYDMARWTLGQLGFNAPPPTLARLMWGFGKLRQMQIARGHRPVIVVRICSGLHDRNETAAPSMGWRRSMNPASATAYRDNLEAILGRIETGWRTMGWPLDELWFLIVPSYPVSQPDDMAPYRASAADCAAGRANVSVIDLERFPFILVHSRRI